MAIATCLLLAVFTWQPAAAQESRGTIVGTVSDSSGAVVPNAPVVVLNKSMGTRLALNTSDQGLYQATFLIPGTYQVIVEMPGFKKFLRDNIEVRVNDRLEVNVALEVGSADQSVTVAAETPLLSTESASVGTVVDSRRVAELPIVHGNPFQLIGLAAGVSFTRDPRLDRPFEPTHIVGYTMGGTRANRSDVTLDGSPATATANNGEVIASYVPPADIVQEFRVQTATFDASFGQTEGGVTNISLKSGSNMFHGTAYYNKMVPELFANDFFANAANIARPDFTYDRWGASLGGPVWIPKIYNGKNKTFFMWGYEGIDEARPRNNGTPTVPTAAMKRGDFSSLLPLGSTYQLYNPFSRVPAAGGLFQAQPFPGNIIPPTMINPVAREILKYYPDPLQPGNPDGTNNYQRPELTENIKYYTHSIRVDHQFTDKHRVFGRYSWYNRNSDYNNYFNNLSTGNTFLFASKQAVFDDVYTLNPTTILNVRYGYNRFIRGTFPNPEAVGFDIATLGFPASYANAIPPDQRQFPRIDLSGYQGTGISGELRPNDIHSITGNLQKNLRKHFIKTGVEFRSYRENSTSFTNEQVGRFNFDGSWTRGPLSSAPLPPNAIGHSVANLLLGLPSGTNSYVQRTANYAEQSTSWGFYVHDDWKVNQRLTLNIGLRWEFETPLTERYNRSVTDFDPTFVQPWEDQARLRYAANPTPEIPPSAFYPRGGLNFAGVNGNDRGLYDPPMTNLMPRFGFAYKMTNKTVVRGGYGIFFGFLGQRRGDVIQTGFTRNTTYIPTNDNGLTFSNTLSNPFPSGILEPVGAAQGGQTFVGQAINFYNKNPLFPAMQRWQFGIQQELFGGIVMEALYMGNRGSHIEISQNLNVTPQQYLSTSPTRDQSTINYLSQNVPNPFSGLLPAGAISSLNGTQIARERLLRPFPQFDTVTAARFDGYSWYHSFQFSVEKRFSRGFTFNLFYTWSKFMQATELLNQDDKRPTEVISDLDRPHRVAISGIYELPFGRGRQLFNNAHPVVNGIIGGWQVSAIYNYQTGAPINFGNLIFTGSDIRALLVDNPTPERWFNPDAGFERNASRQLDRNVRTFPLRFSFLRSDNVNNWDIGVIKNTPVREKLNVQFRAEALNAMNHVLFPAPFTNPTETRFGTVQGSNQANYARRIQLTIKAIF
jgi:hypothetical protein